MTAAAGVWGAEQAAAASPGVMLRYTCTLGTLPSQAMTAQLAWNAPPAVMVGRTTPTITVNATATVGATVTWALGLVGAATVEGSVDAPGVIVAPEGNISAALRLTVPRTGVPSSGPMTVPATGTTPGLVFHQAGHATITVGNDLVLHFTPRDASGNPTAAGSVDLSCTLDPGQSTVVFSFDIAAAAPITTPTTRAAVPGHSSGGGSSGAGTQGAVPPGSIGSRSSSAGSTPSNTTAVSATAQSTVSVTGASTGATTAMVRTGGPAGVDRWLAVAGILVVGVGVIGCAWWLSRKRHSRVLGR